MELKTQISAISSGSKETAKAEEAAGEGAGPLVTDADIATIVSQWTRIPVEKVGRCGCQNCHEWQLWLLLRMHAAATPMHGLRAVLDACTMASGWSCVLGAAGRKGAREPAFRAVAAVQVSSDESEKLIKMEDTLHQRVIGQEEAVVAISRAVRRARVGLKNPNRPIASFIFSGPTGGQLGSSHLALPAKHGEKSCL